MLYKLMSALRFKNQPVQNGTICTKDIIWRNVLQ